MKRYRPRHWPTVDLELRDETITVEYQVAPAEPDVGLPDAYVDEEREIADKCMAAARAYAEPDY